VVTQEPALFTGTIGENIRRLGTPDAPLDAVVDAARRAGIDDEIQQLPMGYDTVLSEGNGLSGGQRQRVALARALLGHPRVLVLDEATSHLDTVTEAAVESGLRGEPGTRLVIAHRLSTIRDADLVIVLDRGRVVEQGGYDQLLRRGGVFARLVADQDSRVVADVRG
jgi:ABC-type multidrug transport system fused ATPase/permease subunit